MIYKALKWTPSSNWIKYDLFEIFLVLICTYLKQSWKRVSFHFAVSHSVFRHRLVWVLISTPFLWLAAVCIFAIAFVLVCMHTLLRVSRIQTRAVFISIIVFILNFCDLNLTDGKMCVCSSACQPSINAVFNCYSSYSSFVVHTMIIGNFVKIGLSWN